MNAPNPQTQYHERGDLLSVLTASKSVLFDPFAGTPDTAPPLREVLLALVKSFPKGAQVRFCPAKAACPITRCPRPAVEVRCGRLQAVLFEQMSCTPSEEKVILRAFHARNRHAMSPISSAEKCKRALIGYCEWRASRDGVLLPGSRVTAYEKYSVRIDENALAIGFDTIPESGLVIDGAKILPGIVPKTVRRDSWYSGGRRKFGNVIESPEQRFAVYTLPKRITDYDPDNALISASFDGEPEITGAAVIGCERRARKEGKWL